MYIANTFFEHDDEEMVTYHDLKSDTADVVSIPLRLTFSYAEYHGVIVFETFVVIHVGASTLIIMH